jgi:hypothetical protein
LQALSLHKQINICPRKVRLYETEIENNRTGSHIKKLKSQHAKPPSTKSSFPINFSIALSSPAWQVRESNSPRFPLAAAPASAQQTVFVVRLESHFS